MAAALTPSLSNTEGLHIYPATHTHFQSIAGMCEPPAAVAIALVTLCAEACGSNYSTIIMLCVDALNEYACVSLKIID